MPIAGEQVMYKTGQKASESGALRCTNCGEQVDIDQGERIPPCPKCAGTEWEMAEVAAEVGAGSRGGSPSSRQRQ